MNTICESNPLLFQALDVTCDTNFMPRAQRMVASGYHALTAPESGLTAESVYEMLCADEYGRNHRAHTLAIITQSATDLTPRISCCARVVITPGGVSDSAPALDAMNFVVPLSGWPHEQSRVPQQAAEVGRFVIDAQFRTPEMRSKGVPQQIALALYQGVLDIIRPLRIASLYAIMPGYATRLLLQAGIELEELPCRLRMEDPEACRVFNLFPFLLEAFRPKALPVCPYLTTQNPMTRMTSSASRYVEILRTAMPEGTVLFDPVQIDAEYRRNVTALERAVPVVLRPQNHDDVARLVALANQHRIPLYPFSTGKNWGLGSKLPVIDGCALVDLAALNQIAWVSEEGPYAVIGPGVTQGQLAAYLAEHHPQFSFNVTGSFAQTSIVGNVLERGDGASARIDDLLGVRGILGNGTPFQTGGVWDNKDLPVHGARYSAGPDLTAIFSQSNFGIVTQMAFRLSRKPERRFVFWGMAKDEQLERVLDTFRHFGEQKVLNPGSVNIGYANRFVQSASTLAAGPATETGVSLARLPSPPDVATIMGKSEPPAPEWNFYALVEGSRRLTDAAIAELTDAFGAFCRVGAYSTDSSEDPYQVLPPFLHPLVKPLMGVPDHRSIQLIYQLTGTAAPADPARMDADFTPFGMKCCIPMVPTNGVAGRRVASLVGQARERHGLNVKLSFFGDGRTLITIHFRSDDAEQVRRATACETELWDRLAEGGFPPYRASIEQMERLCSLRPDFFSIVQQLKSTLDPNGVIAPGRYSRKHESKVQWNSQTRRNSSSYP